MGKKSKFKLAQENTQNAIDRTNEQITELGSKAGILYDQLIEIQNQFDLIRNIPSEKKIEYENLKKIQLSWKEQVQKIEKDCKSSTTKNAGVGAAGFGTGIAVVALGPSAAMGIATTFGVASTGTAISSLSGAAATNAALACGLGGGALAAGGGGMAAGETLLALAGPIGWAIAGVSLLGSGIILALSLSDKKRLENIFTLISERDIKTYEIATLELIERITRITNESDLIKNATKKIKTFGLDYTQMSEAQQYELGSYVNLMSASTQLLVNPILGLQPKYSENDFEAFVDSQCKKESKPCQNANDALASLLNELNKEAFRLRCQLYKNTIISLANLLYKIDIDDKDKKLLWNSFRSNKKMLKAFGITKKEFDDTLMNTIFDALQYKYFCDRTLNNYDI